MNSICHSHPTPYNLHISSSSQRKHHSILDLIIESELANIPGTSRNWQLLISRHHTQSLDRLKSNQRQQQTSCLQHMIRRIWSPSTRQQRTRSSSKVQGHYNQRRLAIDIPRRRSRFPLMMRTQCVGSEQERASWAQTKKGHSL